jgi:hypothetical protein
MPETAAPSSRRRAFSHALGLAVGGAALGAQAASPVPAEPTEGGTPNKIVYQLNKADPEYQEDIFNSVSAMLGKYVDDISIVIAVWGPGIHILAKNPKRPVSALTQKRVRSMAESYGVKFIACNNTMRTVGWGKQDMLDFATVVDFGADAVMRLQQQGYAYLAW